jgi:hypothetical protein
LIVKQDIADWVATFQRLYNDHPYSSLGYVRPNEEHEGLGNAIRQARKDNLLSARRMRLGFYNAQKEGVLGYAYVRDRVTKGLLSKNSEAEPNGNGQNNIIGVLTTDFRHNSSSVLCQNRCLTPV